MSWSGIYCKHTAPSFENIVLLITEIEYFTSSYQVMVILMFIRAAYWLFNSLIFTLYVFKSRSYWPFDGLIFFIQDLNYSTSIYHRYFQGMINVLLPSPWSGSSIGCTFWNEITYIVTRKKYSFFKIFPLNCHLSIFFKTEKMLELLAY